jgi:hypothetical protein
MVRLDASERGDSSVIDPEIDAAKGLDRPSGKCGHLLLIRYVGSYGRSLMPQKHAFQDIEDQHEKWRQLEPRCVPPSQSQQPEVSLRLSGRQKNAWFQKGLSEQPETALPARWPISFSFRPVSPEGRDCANLVNTLTFI